MNSNITTILNGVIANGGSQNRFTQTNANLSANGFNFDLSFTVPASYNGKWNFLKDITVNITKRIGSGNGGAIALLSNVKLFDIISYSDYIAGVSMEGTTFTSGNVARISGYADCGYFGMSSRDALEVTLNVGDRTNLPSADVNFEITAVFNGVSATMYKCFQSCNPTGADQPYKNVESLYYIGNGQNADATVNDQIGTKSVNINSAIAYANSVGRFEFFTNFGEIYKDNFGISQDLSFRVPVISGASVLVVTYSFNPEETTENLKDVEAQRNALIEQIKNKEPDKYKYLVSLGIA